MVVLMDEAARRGFAEKIGAAWRSSLHGNIFIGGLLLEAKRLLPHKHWLPLVKSELPFCARTAQRFMAVASDPRITNTTYESFLPISWATLYLLTKLSDETFQAALASKAINPDMGHADAEDLLRLQRIEDGYYSRRRVSGGPDASDDNSSLVKARSAYLTECKKLSAKLRARELKLCFVAFATTDEERIAERKRRRQAAEAQDYLLAESAASIHLSIPRDEMRSAT